MTDVTRSKALILYNESVCAAITKRILKQECVDVRQTLACSFEQLFSIWKDSQQTGQPELDLLIHNSKNRPSFFLLVNEKF